MHLGHNHIACVSFLCENLHELRLCNLCSSERIAALHGQIERQEDFRVRAIRCENILARERFLTATDILSGRNPCVQPRQLLVACELQIDCQSFFLQLKPHQLRASCDGMDQVLRQSIRVEPCRHGVREVRRQLARVRHHGVATRVAQQQRQVERRLLQSAFVRDECPFAFGHGAAALDDVELGIGPEFRPLLEQLLTVFRELQKAGGNPILFPRRNPRPIGTCPRTERTQARGLHGRECQRFADLRLAKDRTASVDRTIAQERDLHAGAELATVGGFAVAVINGEVAVAESVAGKRGHAPLRNRLFDRNIEPAVTERTFLIRAARTQIEVELALGRETLTERDIALAFGGEQQWEMLVHTLENIVERERRARKIGGRRRCGKLGHGGQCGECWRCDELFQTRRGRHGRLHARTTASDGHGPDN